MAASDNLQGALFNLNKIPKVSAIIPAAPDARLPGSHGGQLFDTAPYRTQSTTAPAPDFLTKNWQLPMFMTPREMHEKFVPLEGDRMTAVGDYPNPWESEKLTDSWRGGEVTSRSHRTDRVTNVRRNTIDLEDRGQSSKPFRRREHFAKPAMESDEELWDRKYDEAYDEYRDSGSSQKYMTPGGRETSAYEHQSAFHEGDQVSGYSRHGDYHARDSLRAPKVSATTYRAVPNEPLPQETLGESVAREGVKHPIWLQAASPEQVIESKNLPGHRGGNADPRPQFLGGHHRAAVLIRSPEQMDRLQPVLFASDIFKARGGEERGPIHHSFRQLPPEAKRRIPQGSPHFGEYR